MAGINIQHYFAKRCLATTRPAQRSAASQSRECRQTTRNVQFSSERRTADGEWATRRSGVLPQNAAGFGLVNDGVYDMGKAIVRRVERAIRSGGDSDAFGVHARLRRVKPQAVSIIAACR